ncbi:FAD-dependent oxidoreductase [Acidimangrovimonas sediminis]|uniref:FAD-dependent oxidoreductase n=1 Tax=Acidimangrovimonas sediminis TaxID=2056283 RepID=UPI000C802344|nr:FAD-dependent oxidoreductase [Acidimangrovimonas sediminis]
MDQKTEPAAAGADRVVDLLVFGAGAGGMTAALVAAQQGLDVLLCEKTAMVGGITSTSGGTIWVPGTEQSRRDGVADSAEDARQFLQAVVGDRGGDRLREAFLSSGAEALAELEATSEVKLAAAKAHPDYVPGPGAAYGGRALAPLEFDGRLLGADFARVRPPRPEFMGLGGMMVTRTELAPLLAPLASAANLRTVLSLLWRYGRDRLRHKRGTRLVMGNALAARLLYSLRKQGVKIAFETGVAELVLEDGNVVGAIVNGSGGRQTIHARRGVVLATGGIAQNAALRERLFPAAARATSLAPETNTGDGVSLAEAIGAAVDDGHDSPALWMPTSRMGRSNGPDALWPHIILDRAKPGLFAVNSAGRRFVNEANSYHDFVMGMLKSHETVPSVPAHLICDASFIRDFGLGLVLPGARGLKAMLRHGYIVEAPTLEALAGKIGVDPTGLADTAADYNRYAASGVDEEFGRGSTVVNRFNGDPECKPNPCLRPVGPGPFYAVAVEPADLACSAGLRGDEDGRVLDAKGNPIRGLYACGNDLTSIFRGTYPGPGTTLGPAIVFGWRVAKGIAAGQALPQI